MKKTAQMKGPIHIQKKCFIFLMKKKINLLSYLLGRKRKVPLIDNDASCGIRLFCFKIHPNKIPYHLFYFSQLLPPHTKNTNKGQPYKRKLDLKKELISDKFDPWRCITLILTFPVKKFKLKWCTVKEFYPIFYLLKTKGHL